MKKADLIKLIENITDDGDINETILGTDEFKDLGKLDLSKLTAEDFQKLITENETIKGYNQSLIDSAVSKGVDTFQNGKMQEIIKKAVDEAKNGKKTPEQEQLEQLQKQFDDSQAELQKERTIGKYTKVLKEKNLPTDLVNFIYGDGKEETIDKNIETIGNIFSGAVDAGVKGKLGTSSYTPPADDATNTLNAQIAAAMGVK
ncbi:DUF4355 domain-containing protein [Clostridium sp. SHJSY1]|uniref:DUF4355 domain-containing protein n=1 Tax=Clostridium sp. SHJSY1 TaxID=2942483 RepID=UPI0028758881|nr:DUF4355 domain-containing protein [Clostridium sp. SHJSY1]MDS0525464.1 DUF4355 domain-containing protein [Clostridium sp. SHJSY1]